MRWHSEVTAAAVVGFSYGMGLGAEPEGEKKRLTSQCSRAAFFIYLYNARSRNFKLDEVRMITPPGDSEPPPAPPSHTI